MDDICRTNDHIVLNKLVDTTGGIKGSTKAEEQLKMIWGERERGEEGKGGGLCMHAYKEEHETCL